MVSTRHHTSRLAHWLRLVSFVLVIALCTVAWLARVATARVDELLGNIGSEAMRYANASYTSEPQTVRLNGLALRIQVGTTDDSVPDVLKAFHARCEQHGAFALRSARGTAGYVACFDPGSGPRDDTSLLSEAKAFGRDLDAAHFGVLRYVTAERSGTHTRYLSAESQGALPLTAAFPRDHDAPGIDPAGAPRPAHGIRLLSSWTEQEPYSVHIYRSLEPASARAFFEAYRDSLARAGFQITPGPRAESLRACKQATCLDVTATLDVATSCAMLSIIRTR